MTYRIDQASSATQAPLSSKLITVAGVPWVWYEEAAVPWVAFTSGKGLIHT